MFLDDENVIEIILQVLSLWVESKGKYFNICTCLIIEKSNEVAFILNKKIGRSTVNKRNE